MDDYRAFMETIEITPMPESFRAVRGQRVLPTGQTHVELRAARNSWAQLSLAVTLPTKGVLLLETRPEFSHRYPLNDITVLRAALELEGLEGRLHPVELVEDDDGVRKADVVLECGSMEVAAYQTNQLLLLIDVPAGTKPGEYPGRIRFYAHSQLYDERLAREITFTLRVEPVALPSGADRKFYLNLWQHVFNIARKSEVAAYTPEHIEALRPYARALGELGNRAITLLLSDIPWCGQGSYRDSRHPSDLYEYNYVRIRRRADGSFRYDFSFAEAYIALMRQYGATDVMFTGLYGIWTDAENGLGPIVEDWPDAIRVSYVDERDGALRFMRHRGEIEDYLRAVYRWICDQGLLKHSYLMGDEVSYGWVGKGWSAVMERIHALMPDIRFSWDLPASVLASETYAGERIDVYTPQLELFAAEKPELRQEILRRIEPDGHCLWSVCCSPPVLNSFLYTDLCEVRLHGLITEHLGMDGFLRWNFTVWPSEPRRCLSLLDPGWPAGDTCFVYPGRGGQCLKSLRYLALKRGIEDFELAQMAKAKGAQAAVGTALECVLREPDLSRWNFEDFFGREKYLSLKPGDYDRARGMLIDALTKEEDA